MEAAAVRWTEKARGALALLEIVTRGRRSKLELVRSLLFAEKVQIARVESIVQDDALVERFYILEHDGTEIVKKRATAIRSMIKKALKRGPVAAA